ncbi:MAG: FAD-linked oxidase C-terminal domain-containing protein [Armatimonadota bacterium]|nr:FAD-linked oxidase C-terminal domain-containing protein [Armatimonadota bacterium]MDR5703959.1 FAD-linked oxidase C-terminal domain-containing protein [Armatimonadota bacterium]MDR7435431.1 FAD-linked oxidase C-terminal domain-containing protein [Armatimonadota bacterium]
MSSQKNSDLTQSQGVHPIGVEGRLADDLSTVVKGEVRFDPFSRVLYSTDASIYQILPIGVVIPKDIEDIVATVQIARSYGIPVLPRGAGTSLAGQAVGRAIVLDCSKYMDAILEVNPEERWARVQPGVVQDELNREVRPYGLRLGPDTATSNRATLGGMIGNNSCGARSLVYGKMVDHVEEVTAVLSTGRVVTFKDLTSSELSRKLEQQDEEGEIYRTIMGILREHREEILRRYPKILRRVSGYNLDALLGDRLNLAKLIVGSEGTLAIVAEAKVRLVERPQATVVGVVHFLHLLEALDAVTEILATGPSAVELIDRMVLEMTRKSLDFSRRLTFVEGDPSALLVVEYAGSTVEECMERLGTMEARLRARGLGYAVYRAIDLPDQENIWQVRKAGQGLLLSVRGDHKPIAFVEDTAVPPEHLPAYIRRFTEILRRHGIEAAFYAHASVGCLHVRPLLNLKDPDQIAMMRSIAEEVFDLVLEFGGAMSGEHGDGIVRSPFVERYFGPTLYRAFKQVKAAFDPGGLMNPGKIVDAGSMTENLRYGPDYRTIEISTALDFSQDGGFARHVELCTGVGACRKKIEGTMCPSYMVTKEEEHSTRGRANLLRAVLSGLLPPEELTGHRLYQALDLCLECKGCKAECPTGVDMAKLKYEFLHHYYQRHGVPLRARLFAHIHTLYQLGARFAPLSNVIIHSRPARWVLHRTLRISRRPLPAFARPTFQAWWERRPVLRSEFPNGEVALFVDTFMNYLVPDVGKAAVEVLERSGYRVLPVFGLCCGRPAISKGLLDLARRQAERNILALAPYRERGIPLVGCEPSCILTFRDEVPDLLRSEEARSLAKQTYLFEEFLLQRWRGQGLPQGFQRKDNRLFFHGHCHQKAIAGTRASVELLRLAGFNVQEVDAGCCGMAGSFGYEAEHEEISLAIAGLRLVPAIRNTPPEVDVVAPGISCRQQIAFTTGRQAYHPAEILQKAFSHTGDL